MVNEMIVKIKTHHAPKLNALLFHSQSQLKIGDVLLLLSDRLNHTVGVVHG